MEYELLIDVGSIVYLPQIDPWKMALCIKEVQITDMVGPSKTIPKGYSKIIWTYGDASTLKNLHELERNEKRLFQKAKLRNSIEDCISFLSSQQNLIVEQIKERKKDLAEEIGDLKVLVNEAEEELKLLTRNMNKNLNMLIHLDIKDDLKRRGLIDYD